MRTTLRVAIVLFHNRLDEVWRCVRALNQSVRHADVDTTVHIGDCSSTPVIGASEVASLQENNDFTSLNYTWFGENLGHSAGSNRLVEGANEDYLLLLNPDTYLAPMSLKHLLASARDVHVGAVDARQIPCEHPKWFDPSTGDQSWASGACLLVRTKLFHEVGGFDEVSFPSYVNDVDLSWRLKLAGSRVVHQPKAVVFHDKRLDDKAHVAPTSIEWHAGLLGRLKLLMKYDRADLVEETIEVVTQHGHDDQKRAVADFRKLDEDDLPAPLPNASTVAEFIDFEYGRRRF